MLITSADNKLIKYAASLKNKKYRDQSGDFLAEGLRSVADIFAYAPHSVRYCFVPQAFGCLYSFEFLRSLPDEKLIELPQNLLKKLSDTTSPQDIVAVVTQKPQSDITAKQYCLFLDRIRDPGNLGTIIRTAAAAGYALVLNDCADMFSPKVVRSSMSAIMTADFAFGGVDTLNLLKSKGFLMLAAEAKGKCIYNLGRTELDRAGTPNSADIHNSADTKKQKICIVIGNEANGISPQILDLCDLSVSIPMQGAESLNAASAAAVLMYHLKYGI